MTDMTDRDNITLPREVVKLALEAFEAVMPFSTTQRELKIRAVEALRTHLAAPKQEHPGYIIGSHWLETAYSRICAGEAEADVLRDIGLVRITDGMVETADIHAIVDRQEALRRDAERYRWLRDTAPEGIGDMASVRDSFDTSEIDAAIDAAMKEGKT